MRLMILPPRADPTLEVEAAGWTVVDMERAFADRVLRPDRLLQEAAAAAASGAATRRLLLLRSAAELLDAPHRQTRLRAMGAAYAGICDPESGLELRLDDLELTAGTTERLADVLALPARRSPFVPEIEAAVAAATGAERVLVWLEQDQQLPAAAALVERLSASGRPGVAGAFASAHWRTLGARPPLSAARLVATPAVTRRLRVVPGHANGEATAWRDAPGEPVPDGVWAGRVSLSEVVGGALPLDRCRFAVAGFCAAHDEVVAPDGWRIPRAEMARARPASLRLVGEWLVGAPGIGRQDLERTLAEEDRAPLFDWIAGLRRFHWPVDRAGVTWAGREVVVGEPPAELDLARFRPVACPGTIAPDQLDDVIAGLFRRLDERAPLVAGRIAAAFASQQPAPVAGRRVELDPDCALVELPGDDGRARWTAVNLRTGVALALDARLAPHVADLRRPAEPEAALARLPAPVRERALSLLRARAVIRSCA